MCCKTTFVLKVLTACVTVLSILYDIYKIWLWGPTADENGVRLAFYVDLVVFSSIEIIGELISTGVMLFASLRVSLVWWIIGSFGIDFYMMSNTVFLNGDISAGGDGEGLAYVLSIVAKGVFWVIAVPFACLIGCVDAASVGIRGDEGMGKCCICCTCLAGSLVSLAIAIMTLSGMVMFFAIFEPELIMGLYVLQLILNGTRLCCFVCNPDPEVKSKVGEAYGVAGRKIGKASS